MANPAATGGKPSGPCLSLENTQYEVGDKGPLGLDRIRAAEVCSAHRLDGQLELELTADSSMTRTSAAHGHGGGRSRGRMTRLEDRSRPAASGETSDGRDYSQISVRWPRVGGLLCRRNIGAKAMVALRAREPTVHSGCEHADATFATLGAV